MDKLENFYFGRVVFWTETNGTTHVGHVVGFGENCMKEPLIKVQFSDIYVNEIHDNMVQAPDYILPEKLRFKA